MSHSRKRIPMILLLAFILYVAGCSSAATSGSPPVTAGPKTELLISAAASLSDSLKDIQSLFEQNNPDIKLTFNLASSGTLQQQIEQGAPADLFISAGAKQMDALTGKGLVDPKQRMTLLTGELVVIVPLDSKAEPANVADLAGTDWKKIAVGDPGNVPAGQYAKAAMDYFKSWETLQPKLIPAKDVRQVLTYVETGNADAGFVYKTDALTSKKVRIALTVDPVSHPRIDYPAGIVRATKHPKEAERFYAFLQSKEAAAIFAKYGFTVPQS